MKTSQSKSDAEGGSLHPLVRSLPEALLEEMRACKRTWGMSFLVISAELLIPFWHRVQQTAIRDFCEAVERRAEEKMLKTGKLEGAHYAAMNQLRDEVCGANVRNQRPSQRGATGASAAGVTRGEWFDASAGSPFVATNVGQVEHPAPRKNEKS